MVDTLVDLAQRRRVGVVFLACLEKHRAFYEACGFSQMPGMRCDRFVNVNVPAIAMCRDLRSNDAS